MRNYAAALALAALLAGTAGCAAAPSGNGGTNGGGHGGGSAVEATVDSGGAVTVRDASDRKMAFKDTPRRIVALGNGELDIVYSLGGSLVGRPTSAAPPSFKEAEKAEQVGSTHEVDLEKITFAKPDLILANYPLNVKDIATLEGTGAKVVLTAADSVADIESQIRLFGTLLRQETRAAELTKRIDDKLAQLAGETAADAAKPRVLMVYGAPGTNMAALPNSLGGDLLKLAGGDNVAAKFASLQSFPQYAALNTERVMEADPQLIVIMTHGDPEAVRQSFVKEMSRSAAWNSLDAVKNGHVEVLPSDLFGTNPGTRVVEALDLLRGLVKTAAAEAAG